MRVRVQGKLTENEAQWAERLRRLEASGLTRREFAAREGVSPNAISWWRWTLRRRQEQRRLAAGQMQFVELKTLTARDEGAASGGFEVVLARGRVVRVRPGFDARELSRLVAALEGAQS